MGTVYRASHLGLERPVAIKILKQEFAAYPEVADRFMREARTMARLKHPRAAMIFDAGRLADGRPFIVMEYVEGETLADALLCEGPFAPARAVRVAAEICEVLAEAHALGIVHRDLKPSNIMLTERGVCVLDSASPGALDFRTPAHAPTTVSGVLVAPALPVSRHVGRGRARIDLYILFVRSTDVTGSPRPSPLPRCPGPHRRRTRRAASSVLTCRLPSRCRPHLFPIARRPARERSAGSEI